MPNTIQHPRAAEVRQPSFAAPADQTLPARPVPPPRLVEMLILLNQQFDGDRSATTSR